MALLYAGGAGRLTVNNGGFRPGQVGGGQGKAALGPQGKTT
jgi:hypothetical protein